MRAIIIIAAAVLVQGADPLVAQTLTCSTWQGIRTCRRPTATSAMSGTATG